MKQLLVVIGLVVIGFIVYSWLSGGGGGAGVPVHPTPAPPTAVTSTPGGPGGQSTEQQGSAPGTPPTQAAQPTPDPYAQYRAAPPVNPSQAAQPAATPVDTRSAEVRQIIYDCARRAEWRITRYEQPAYGVSRVTGNAINDNTRNQRFLDEIQRSGILTDIESGPSRVFTGRDQRQYMENTILIKWR